MTDKNAVGVTVISHDSENRTLVVGFDPKRSYSRDVKYLGTSLLQLANLVAVSYQCEQFIRYECMASVMQISLYAWWVSRDGVNMDYWGGAAPGSRKCACGMTNSCPKCNCDRNDYVLREDSGYLTDKLTLPVTQLRFGDTGEAGEYGYHTLGKLYCYGFSP